VRFGFGKRATTPPAPARASEPAARTATPAEAAPLTAAMPIRIYNMGPSQEMRWMAELLASKGIAFEDLDVSADVALQSWIKARVGSPEYPQAFRDRTPMGDLATLRRLDLEGNLERVLAGLPPIAMDDGTIDVDPIRGAAAVLERLRRGDVLSLTTPDGETFDTWAEVFANPPRVYYRGEPRPLDELDGIVAEVAFLLEDPRTDAAWSTGR